MDTNDFKKTLGKYISELRLQKGFSQEQLAFETNIDRTYMGAIERGETNVTIDRLQRIAYALGKTVGMLIIEAEEHHPGILNRPFPRINPSYLNKEVELPPGITHQRLLVCLNKSLELLNELPLRPHDWSSHIYSGLVSRTVIKHLSVYTDFQLNRGAQHPSLYHGALPKDDPNWGLDIQATQDVAKGGETRQPIAGWLMIIAYNAVEEEIRFLQIKLARLLTSDWAVHQDREKGAITRAARTTPLANQLLRASIVYRDLDRLH